jgi:hypothetical protein
MSEQLTRLAERRRRLVAQATAQRTVLAYQAEPWRARLAVVDQGVALFRYIRRHPVMTVGVTLLLVALRPRGTGKWLQRGLVAWELGRRLRSLNPGWRSHGGP